MSKKWYYTDDNTRKVQKLSNDKTEVCEKLKEVRKELPGQTDGQTDGWTDRQTDEANYIEPAFSWAGTITSKEQRKTAKTKKRHIWQYQVGKISLELGKKNSLKVCRTISVLIYWLKLSVIQIHIKNDNALILKYLPHPY